MAKVSDVEKMIAIAREVQPDLWRRTEQVARIIDPGAFVEGVVIHPDISRRRFDAHQKYQRAIAMRRAQEVLCFLGVNTETDWLEILTRLAQQDGQDEEKGEDV